MDDEFKLCWKNFQDNIASGFQNLYDRGDLVDVTLACDGKLLHAHKIVLAICSPYFQEIFITNPCKHPIIILKDVHFNIMCELLEFMYQGVVNVKHTELQSFMKIGQLLHIKGLATNSSAANTLSEKSSNKKEGPTENTTNMCTDPTKSPSVTSDASRGEKESNSVPTTKGSFGASLISPASSPSPVTSHEIKGSPDSFMLHGFQSSVNQKRPAESDNDSQIFYNKKQFRKSSSHTDQFSDQINDDRGTDHAHPEDFFLSSVPHISMTEPRYDISNIKREGDPSGTCISNSGRNSLGTPFGFDYNLYKNNCDTNIGTEFSNELNLINDCSKNFANHMDIPPIAPGEHWFQGKLEFMLSQRGKPLLVHDGHTFGIQYVRKDKKYWQCNLSRKFNCKARVTTTDTGEIIVTNNEHCHTEIRQHLRKDYQRNKVMMNALINLSANRFSESLRRQSVSSIGCSLSNMQNFPALVHNSATDTPKTNQSLNQYEESVRTVADISGSEAGSSISNTDGLKPSNLQEKPLDCGTRSLTNEALSQ